jgi:hypothetical protein
MVPSSAMNQISYYELPEAHCEISKKHYSKQSYEFPLLVVTITVDAAKYIATRLMVPARHTRMNEEQESPINLQPIPDNIFMLRNK